MASQHACGHSSACKTEKMVHCWQRSSTAQLEALQPSKAISKGKALECVRNHQLRSGQITYGR
jgi:hypothetical protein